MSNRFRKQYRALSPSEAERVEQIKDAAERLEQLIESIPVPSDDLFSGFLRARAQAMINLEQSVMWAVKAAT